MAQGMRRGRAHDARTLRGKLEGALKRLVI
jgi:hypothetical protein